MFAQLLPWRQTNPGWDLWTVLSHIQSPSIHASWLRRKVWPKGSDLIIALWQPVIGAHTWGQWVREVRVRLLGLLQSIGYNPRARWHPSQWTSSVPSREQHERGDDKYSAKTFCLMAITSKNTVWLNPSSDFWHSVIRHVCHCTHFPADPMEVLHQHETIGYLRKRSWLIKWIQS